jgi:hypothetical protein
MAYREFSRMEIIELVRRWQAAWRSTAGRVESLMNVVGPQCGTGFGKLGHR